MSDKYGQCAQCGGNLTNGHTCPAARDASELDAPTLLAALGVKQPERDRFHAGYIEGLRHAAREVRTHWNDIYTSVAQKGQAERSASILDDMANRFEKSGTLPPSVAANIPDGVK